jgi:hypothetical protein
MTSLVGLAAAVPALLLSASCCCKAPDLVQDVFSGGPHGYGFVKVAVTIAIDPNTKKCSVKSFEPRTVHVFRGSAIRWKVTNACDPTGAAKRHLKFTNPQPTSYAASAASTPRTKTAGEQGGEQPPKPFAFANCGSAEVLVGAQTDSLNVLLCEVPNDVAYAVYKYGLEGEIEPYDPDLEVHGPGK